MERATTVSRGASLARYHPERSVGIAFVAVLHAAALYGLWQHRLLPTPTDVATPLRELHRPAGAEEEGRTQAPAATQAEAHRETPAPADRRRDARRRAHRLRRSATAAQAGTGIRARSSKLRPCPCPPARWPCLPNSRLPVLSASAPSYPALSRRFGEEGVVVLRVELDETGRVAIAKVASSSGSPAARRSGPRRRAHLALHAGHARWPAGTGPRTATLQIRSARKLITWNKLRSMAWALPTF